MAARRAEELGLDAFAIGERHAGEFLSAGDRYRQGQRGTALSAVRRHLVGPVPGAALAARWGDPLFTADTTQQARDQYGPAYEGLVARRNVPGNNMPFRDIDDAIAEGPALAGSPQQVIDKILSYYDCYGRDLQSVSLPTTLPFGERLRILKRLATEVLPAGRREAPTTLWAADDPHGSRPELGVRAAAMAEPASA